jgi:hypothetical protein
MANAQHLSLTDQHFTPPPIIEASRIVLKGIDFDPFSSEFLNKELVKAKSFFDGSKGKDGFIDDYPEVNTIFCNPPGGKFKNKSNIARGWDRVHQFYLDNHDSSAIFVGFSLELLTRRPEILEYPICFINSGGHDYYPEWVRKSGRLCYAQWELEKGFYPEKSPTHGSFISYLPFRTNLDVSVRSFIDVFDYFGFSGVMSEYVGDR